MRFFHRLPGSARMAFAIDWCVRAARYERRILFAAVLSIMVWLALAGALLFATAFGGVMLFLVLGGGMALMTFLGIAVPIFAGIAYGGLWRAHQTWTPAGIIDAWVNPDLEGQAPYDQPGYMRRVNGRKTLIILDGWGDEWDGKHLPYRRRLPLYTVSQVHKAIDKDSDIEHFSQKRRIPRIPVRMGAIAVIIASSLFIGLAVLTSEPPAPVEQQTMEVTP
jgi:hypothetical protein